MSFFRSPNTESQVPVYMEQNAEKLKQIINAALQAAPQGRRWIMNSFRYEPVSCAPGHRNGIACVVESPTRDRCILYYPYAEYPTLAGFLDSLNFDMVYLKIRSEQPSLGMDSADLSEDYLKVLHPARRGETLRFSLREFYDCHTGEFKIGALRDAITARVESQGFRSRTRGVLPRSEQLAQSSEIMKGLSFITPQNLLELMKDTIVVYSDLNPGVGKAVFISGGDELLGSWESATRLEFDIQQQAWFFNVPAGVTQSEYKFLTGNFNQGKQVLTSDLTWEVGENHQLLEHETNTENRRGLGQ